MTVSPEPNAGPARQPLVSVVTPTFNAADYLREAIESVLAQSYPNIEMIVVDDGSTDHTRRVCESFGDRIRYFHQANDGTNGASAAIRGFGEARGALIASFDHDDRWLPGKIARQVAALEAHPEVGVVFTRFRIIDGEGRVQGVSPLTGWSGDVFHRLLGGNQYCNSAALFRRSLLDEAGHQDPRSGLGDWDLWLRFARLSPFLMLDEVLTEYRVHGAGFSADRRIMAEATRRVLEGQRARLHPDCAECRRGFALGMNRAGAAFLEHGHQRLRALEWRAARASFREAWRTAPSAALTLRQPAAWAKSLILAGVAGVRLAARRASR